MPISTYKVFLMFKISPESEYKKLVNIKDFPDLGGAPEMLETTTLSDKMKTFIPGIQSLDALTFTANFDKTDYATLSSFNDDETDFAIYFGGSESGSLITPTGEYGKFEFKGRLSVYVNGGGVNEVVGMTITIAPSTPIKFSSAA